MTELVYEVVAAVTLDRGEARISLTRGARLRLEPGRHDFNERQLRRAIHEGKLRALPLSPVR